MKILVVEDDKGIASGLRITLQHRGYKVAVCDSIAVAWTALTAEPFDMVLLDLGLPDGDGSDLLRRVRAAGTDGARLPDPTTPVLIMTARERVADRILGLNQGADDYLVKPFDVDELEARIRALARRTTSRVQPLIKHRDLTINPANRAVQRNGQTVDLSPREFSLLLLMLESRGTVLTRAQMEKRLYSWQGVVDSNAVEVHIHHLRRKLGEGLIQTVRGVGYFIAKEETPETAG